MSRTLIVGSSKSGKSTLAKKLAKEKGLPVYVLMCYEDLDSIRMTRKTTASDLRRGKA